MSISLVTDGMLCPIVRLPVMTAPDDGEAIVGPTPVTPCAVTGAPTNTPPAAPGSPQAVGPDVPSVPCGIVGSDPTITPPSVPSGQEGSETTGDEAPAIPSCPKGEVT